MQEAKQELAVEHICVFAARMLIYNLYTHLALDSWVRIVCDRIGGHRRKTNEAVGVVCVPAANCPVRRHSMQPEIAQLRNCATFIKREENGPPVKHPAKFGQT